MSKVCKAFLALSFLIFWVAFNLKAQNDSLTVKAVKYLNFKNMTDLPYVMEWPATITDGKCIYAINGYVGMGKGFNPDVLKYDPLIKKWSLLTNKAGYKLQPSAVFLPGDSLAYLFGGIGRGGFINQTVQSLDLTLGTVEDLKVHNPMATTYGYAAQWENKIYIFGGTQHETHTIASMYCFDPKTRQFIQLADMPESLQTPGCVVNGVLYTFGGFDVFLSRRSQNINAYHIETNTWTTVARLPRPLSADVVVPCGDLVFVIGDYDDETFLGYYNTRTGIFTELRSNMEGRRACGAAIIDNILYVFGGKSQKHQVAGGSRTGQYVDISDIIKKEAAF
jgi:N-acetylneuraminic acid mutarotase